MTDDLLQYAQVVPIGVGTPKVPELLGMATPAPPIDPRTKPVRHRPNRGRKRRYIGPLLAEPPWDMLRATGYPLPPTIQCMDRVPPMWRRGPQYVQWRIQVKEMWGTTCHLCGHDQAFTSDHLVPLSVWGNQPYDPALSRPAHGIEGCPTCHVKCNSSRGNRRLAIQIANYKPAIEL